MHFFKTVIIKLAQSFELKMRQHNNSSYELLDDLVNHYLKKYKNINDRGVNKISYHRGLYSLIDESRYNSALRRVCYDAHEKSEELLLCMLAMINDFSKLLYSTNRSQNEMDNQEDWENQIRSMGLWIDVDEKNSFNQSLRDYAQQREKKRVLKVLQRVNQKMYSDALHDVLICSVQDSLEVSRNGMISQISQFLDIEDLVRLSRVNLVYNTLFNREIKHKDQEEVYCVGQHTVIIKRKGSIHQRVFLCFDRTINQTHEKTITELKMPAGFKVHTVKVNAVDKYPFIMFFGKNSQDLDQVFYYGDVNLFIPSIPSHSPINWKLQELKIDELKIRDVYCAYTSSIFVGKDSNNHTQVQVCGGNQNGQLGIDDNNDEIYEFTKLNMPEGFHLKDVARGHFHTIFMGQKDGRSAVFVCGSNEFGQLGFENVENIRVLTELVMPEDFSLKNVICGSFHTIFMGHKKGMTSVFVSGWNNCGQLGLGNNPYEKLLTELCMPKGFCLESISCGAKFTVFVGTINNQPEVFVCGDNSDGQLGLNDFSNRLELTKIDLPEDFTPKSVVCGDSHMMIRGRGPNNEVYTYACGSNENSQLGFKNIEKLSRLTKLSMNDVMENVDSTMQYDVNEALLNNTSLLNCTIS